MSIDERDGWGVPARAIALQLSEDHLAEVAPLLDALSSLGSRKPSQRWRREAAAAAGADAARSLLERWLRLAAEAEPVPDPPVTRLGLGPSVLLVGGNVDLVRAACWATADVPASWPAPLLAALVGRGSQHNGVDPYPEALSLRAASAALDCLIARDSPDDRSELHALLGSLRRRDLLTRIGKAVGRESDAASRSSQLAREKARAARAKASPVPRKARSAVDSLLREAISPTLRELGFTGSPRAWRRIHADRVEVVHCSAGSDGWAGANTLGLAYGLRWQVAHPDGTPESVEPRKADLRHLDLYLHGRFSPSADPLSPEGLAQTCAHLREHVVPLLEQLAAPQRGIAVLRGEALASGEELAYAGQANPRSGVIGMLALADGDADLAEACFEQAGRELEPRPGAYGAEEYFALCRAWRGFYAAELERLRRTS